MGKSTDEYSKKLTELSLKFNNYCPQVHGKFGEIKKLEPLGKEAEKTIKELSDAEKRLTEAKEQLSQVKRDFSGLVVDIHEINGKMGELYKEILKTLNDFEKYIEKKKKSKNPFKSKESLPKAEKTIKTYRDALDDFQKEIKKSSVIPTSPY